LGLLVVYLILRISFTAYHIEKLQGLSAYEWILLYLNGFRFDLAAVTPFTLLFVLVALLPNEKLRLLNWFLVTGATALFVLVNGADTVLLEFTGRRFSRASLLLVGEGSWKNLLSYSIMATVSFCSVGLSIYFCRWSWRSLKLSRAADSLNLKQKFLVIFISLVLSVIFVRGGFQLKPISFVDSKIIDHTFSHQVILNSTFTFFTSLGKKGIEKQKYFLEDEVRGYLNLNPAYYTTTKIDSHTYNNYNVVFFILESFSNEYFGKTSTPFLMDLKNSGGVFFDKAYANGRRSVEGIAALFAGIPALMENAFISSEYATNEFIGLGQLFKNKGYRTSFFHAAVNGSMRFDQFTKSAGFDEYYGKNEFPDQSQDDGRWGIYDGPFLQWACEQQSEKLGPFLSSIFTLSSHHPFRTPKDFDSKWAARQMQIKSVGAKSESETDLILKSVGYTDDSLRKYFDCAEKKPWFKNTLFIFVGDHTGPTLKAAPTMADLFHITLGFYAPGRDLNPVFDTDQFVQQIDILPTLNDLFSLGLVDKNHLSRSILQPGKKSVALYSDQHWEIIGDTPDLKNSLKATQQYFSEAMIDNRLYYPSSK
jgi:phosphoglycerol transferase MdoB-like AlkP superfamily enzyme